MQTRSTAIFLFSSLLLSACGDNGDDRDGGVSPMLQDDLQVILDGAVADGVTPGVVLHVTDGDDGWSTAAGLAELDGEVGMTPDTRFRAGSMLKTFVATAVLQAVERGDLELDDVLTDHLPPAITDRIAHASEIDVRMLLSHRSGIPDWVNEEVKQVVVQDPAHVWSLDDVLDMAGSAPVFEPGASFGYSNTNYAVLGELLTEVYGRSWREVVADEVFARAGLDDTSLPEPGDLDCDGCAHGYIPLPDGDMLDATHVDPSMAGAGGGHALITTAADLSRFHHALREGELFEHASTLDAMLAFQPANDPEELPAVTGYGLGVLELEIDDLYAIGHMGGTAGYLGFMLYVPATDRFISGDINVMGDIGAVLVPILERVSEP